MVESASTEAALSEVTQRVSGLLQETESVFASGKLDSSPYGHAAKRATDEMRAHLDLWRGDFADPNRLARWRESFDSLLSRAISALAQLYNAGERS